MNATWKEKQIAKCIKRGNRRRWMKPLMLAAIVLVIGFDRVKLGLFSHKKRMMSAAMAVLVFLVSSSFATPSADVRQENGEGLAQEEAPAFQEEGEEGGLTGQEELYSADEILSGSHSRIISSQASQGGAKEGFSKDDWNLILVNKQHPVPEDYSFELGVIIGDMECDVRILPELLAMLEAAKEDGVNLVVRSSYRDISLQSTLFDRKIELYMSQGATYLEAYREASQIVTIPGASEHQIGLALDIVSEQYTLLNEGFGETEAGRWLQEHSREYGFILRYPEGKEYITGIDYEPWHFRYVGREAATLIMDSGITLEEFTERISD